MSSPRRASFPFGIEPGIVHRLPADLFAGLESRIRDLHTLRARRRLRDLACYVGLWLVGSATLLWQMSAAAPSNLLVTAIGTLLAALGLNGFILLVHEGMHGTLFRRSRVNRVLSVLLSCTHLMSFTAYQVLHIRHHKNVGCEGDPDHYANYVRSKPLLWLAHGVRLAAASFLYLIAIPTLAWRTSPRTARRRILEEYAVLFALLIPILMLVPAEILITLWFIPMIIVALITQVRAFAQHTLTNPSEPLLAARSMRPRRIISYIMLHENFHLEHHLFPRVPSYNLPELARLLEPRLPKFVVGSSYLALILRFLLAARTLDETPIVVRERASEGRFANRGNPSPA